MAAGGYAWWYIDALSDDGEQGITIIAFIGSVFSPYYAWARRRARFGAADPLNHCAVNVALYRRGGAKHWAMTERGRHQVQRSATALTIGPSSLRWDDGALVITLDEVTAPWCTRLRGEVRVTPAAIIDRSFALDALGLHRWRPIAPVARVEVRMSQPGVAWSGPGYVDSNSGRAPLESHFSRWDWSRAALSGQRSAVLYDVTRRDGSEMSLALLFDAEGSEVGGGRPIEAAPLQAFMPPPRATLPHTGWRVARHTRCDAGRTASVTRTLEDAPFYTRSQLSTHLCGEPVSAVHESLSLARFDTRWVQSLLPFRMPRVSGR
ncbi:carotenoid 1,2-hydratase [soil metagenome]